MHEIFTIGHSNKPIEQFLSLLRSHDIKAVADVRRFPGSRRYPHFTSENLAASLAKSEIEYLHFPELGGRRAPRKDSPNTAWENDAFRGYADFMMTKDFERGIQRLCKTAEQKKSVLMCAEALWWQCHRSLIADFLKSRGWKVLHILSETKTEEHPFTSPARIVDGKLTYASPATPLEFRFS